MSQCFSFPTACGRHIRASSRRYSDVDDSLLVCDSSREQYPMNSVLSELCFGVHQTAGTVIQTVVDPYLLVYLTGWWVRKEFCWFEVVGRLGALMCVLVEHTPFLFRLHAGLSLCACSMSRLYNARLVSLAVPWLDPLVLACHVTQAFDRACSLSSTLTLLGSSLTWFLHSSTFRTVWFLQ